MKVIIKLEYSPEKPFPKWIVKLENEERDFGSRGDTWDNVVNFLIEKRIKSSEIKFSYEGGEPARIDFENMFKYLYNKIHKKV